MSTWLYLASIPLLVILYIFRNDRILSSIPPEALKQSPNRVTREEVLRVAQELQENPLTDETLDQLGAKTGRRYIVVGGSGFLGGWIVLHLLQRGEDPRCIRALDIRGPLREDLLSGLAQRVEFVKVDITNASQVKAAFNAPWPTGIQERELTVFHTAASIRFFENHPALLYRSREVNVKGMENVIEATVSAGASILITTSSGSQGVWSTRFLLWPWERQPKKFVQMIGDGPPEGDSLHPTEHRDFFSNYAKSKAEGELLVRTSDNRNSGSGVLRTGCIRPCNGVFGPGGDQNYGFYLIRRTLPTWISNVVQNFLYVENCSIAHLCYEAALLNNAADHFPDIGGQSFNIADPCVAPTYGDGYLALVTLDPGMKFIMMSPTAMLLVAHVVQIIYLGRFFLLSSKYSLLRKLGRLFPVIQGDIEKLQPSLWNLCQSHLIFDDSRARLPRHKGGLGYSGTYTTLQGLCKTVDVHLQGQRSQAHDIASRHESSSSLALAGGGGKPGLK